MASFLNKTMPRPPRPPRSLLGPVVLVLFGTVTLLAQTGHLSWRTALTFYAHGWPLLLIGAGVFLAAEWGLDRARVQPGSLHPRATRRMGGGVVWLLVLLALGGALLRSGERLGVSQSDGRYFYGLDLLHAVGTPHDSDSTLSSTVPPGGSVSIDNPVGDVVVSGTSSDSLMHIDVHKQVYAWNETDAAKREERLQPTISSEGSSVTVRTLPVDAGQADLTITLPAGVSLTVNAGNGDVRVSTVAGPVTINSQHGDVDLSGITGATTAHLHSSDATFSAHELSAGLQLDGHTGDINLSSIGGPVRLVGEFFGTTHLEKLAGPIAYRTSRTDLQMARLDGEMEFDTGSSLHADQLTGPVVLLTKDREITLDGIHGSLQLSNTNGDVNITAAEPLGPISVTNKRGLVDIGVPVGPPFSVSAETQHGAGETDFGLEAHHEGDSTRLTGTIGNGVGPAIHLETSDGDITLRKSISTH